MKPNAEPDTNSLEDEVMRRAAHDFMASAGASAPVIDVEPSARQTQKKPRGGGLPKGVIYGAIGAVLLAVLTIAVLARTPEPAPMSPMLTEIDRASKGPLPAVPAPAVTAVADTPAPPSPETATGAAPAVDSPPAVAVDAATGLAAPVAPAPAPAPAPELTPALPGESVEAGASTDVAALQARVRELEQQKPAPSALPTTIQVAEILTDGVVLRDGHGRTLVVPQGGRVTAASGRVVER